MAESRGSDEEAIRRTLAGYCQTCDDGRFEEFASLFAVSAVFHVPPGDPVQGREAIRKFMEAAQPPEARGKHLCGEPLITLSGDEAEVTTDFVFVGRRGDRGWSITTTGRYHDTLARDPDGMWRFTTRTIFML